MKTHSKVLIYGSGGFSSMLRVALESSGRVIEGLIDRAEVAAQKPDVYSISEALSLFGDIPVYVGVFSPQPDLVQITRNLKEAGFSSPISPASAALQLSHEVIELEQYWLTASREILDLTKEQAPRFRNCLSDIRSRKIFDSLLQYRLTGIPDAYPRPDPLTEQYVASDLDFLGQLGDGMIVDCGAFTGDSIQNWVSAGLRDRRVLAFEPDGRNYTALLRYTQTSDLPTIPLPLGVASQSGHFEMSGSGASSRLSQKEDGNVVCIAIDDLVSSFDVSMIKMDIEGGEFDALQGAMKTIGRCLPSLAISVYHRPSDLWQIGTWIAEHFPTYDMHLRCYGHQGYDVVLLCVPKK